MYLEGAVADGLRREAALTCGPAASATETDDSMSAQSRFQIDFEFPFEFKSNHSIQKIQMQQHECSITFLPLYLILN
jgi:hypothetical protein